MEIFNILSDVNEDGNFFDKIINTISEWFNSIGVAINDFIKSIFSIDQFLFDLYFAHISPLPEIVKLLGALLVGFILVLGVISLIKKSLKLVIILAVIVLIVILLF